MLIALLLSAALAQDKADGTIVEDVACTANPIATYEQYVQRVRKQYADQVEAAAKEGFTMTVPANVADSLPDRKWFERARAYEGFECHHIKYMSDGLKVSGYLWKPKDTSGAPRPLIIFNRGGNREFSAVTPWLWSGFYAFLEKGYVVVASQYRGNDGGEGREEFGGAEVHDVLNLIPLAKSLGYVDMNNVFLLGFSRGGMETYLALKQGINVNAAAVISGLADMLAGSKERPELVERVHKELIPDFDKRPQEVMRERSAVYWADRINAPLLILHGTADWRSDPSTHALALALKLQELHKTYELVMYSGDNHGVMINKLDADRRILEWFKRYTRSR
jgi:dipeptidyl aminopeptidase/acylaminoacyl peptidase